jgi:Predicted transcriptional regulators
MYNKLKGLMREYHITQEKLAEKLEMSITTLNFKINGKSDFTVTEAKVISNLLKKTMDEIFYKN